MGKAQRTCNKKISYRSRASAADGVKGFFPYRCSVCDLWHSSRFDQHPLNQTLSENAADLPELTKRELRYRDVLFTRIRILEARLKMTPIDASFYGEIKHELKAMQWIADQLDLVEIVRIQKAIAEPQHIVV